MAEYSGGGRRGGEEAVSALRQQLEASRLELARARQQAEVGICVSGVWNFTLHPLPHHLGGGVGAETAAAASPLELAQARQQAEVGCRASRISSCSHTPHTLYQAAGSPIQHWPHGLAGVGGAFNQPCTSMACTISSPSHTCNRRHSWVDMRIPAASVRCNKGRRAGQIIHMRSSKAFPGCNSRQPLADQFCA